MNRIDMSNEDSNPYELARPTVNVVDRLFRRFRPTHHTSSVQLAPLQTNTAPSYCHTSHEAMSALPYCPANLHAHLMPGASELGYHHSGESLAISFDDITNDQIMYEDLNDRSGATPVKSRVSLCTKVIGVIFVMNFVATSAGLTYFIWRLMELESRRVELKAPPMGTTKRHDRNDITYAVIAIDQEVLYKKNDDTPMTLNWKSIGENSHVGANISTNGFGLTVKESGTYVVYSQLQYYSEANQSYLIDHVIERFDKHGNEKSPVAKERVIIDGTRNSRDRQNNFYSSRLFQLVYLLGGEQVVVKANHQSMIISYPEYSFFGLYRYSRS